MITSPQSPRARQLWGDMKQSSTNQSAHICIFTGTIILSTDRTLILNHSNISLTFSLLIFIVSFFLVSLSILIFTNLPSLNDLLYSQAFCLEISFGGNRRGSLAADSFPSSNFFSLYFSAASFASLGSFGYSIAS